MAAEPAPPAGRAPCHLVSLHQGLAVIDCFTSRAPWSVAELVQRLLRNKATLFCVLQTLGAAAVHHQARRWQPLPPLPKPEPNCLKAPAARGLNL